MLLYPSLLSEKSCHEKAKACWRNVDTRSMYGTYPGTYEPKTFRGIFPRQNHLHCSEQNKNQHEPFLPSLQNINHVETNVFQRSLGIPWEESETLGLSSGWDWDGKYSTTGRWRPPRMGYSESIPQPQAPSPAQSSTAPQKQFHFGQYQLLGHFCSVR